MATSKEYINYVLEQLDDIGHISIRPMMGEYCLYYKEKLIGLICDARVLIKKCKASDKMLKGAPLQYPYQGSKSLMYVIDVDEADSFKELFESLYLELPERKIR